MKAQDFNQTLMMLRKEISLLESHTNQLCARFQEAGREMESLKADSLRYGLEYRKGSLDYQAGFASIKKDGKKLRISLAAAVARLLIEGALTKDGPSAVNAGISGFDGMLQEFGRSDYAVSLDEDLMIVQKKQIAPGRFWVTLHSLLLALEVLKENARGGESLGDVATTVAKLKESPTELMHLFPVIQWVRVTKSTKEITETE